VWAPEYIPYYQISWECGPQNTFHPANSVYRHPTKSVCFVGSRIHTVLPSQCSAWAPEHNKPMRCVSPRIHTILPNQLGVWAPERIPSSQISVVCGPQNTYHITTSVWCVGPRTQQTIFSVKPTQCVSPRIHTILPNQLGVLATERIPSCQLNGDVGPGTLSFQQDQCSVRAPE
jgi:hypothetical protein